MPRPRICLLTVAVDGSTFGGDLPPQKKKPPRGGAAVFLFIRCWLDTDPPFFPSIRRRSPLRYFGKEGASSLWPVENFFFCYRIAAFRRGNLSGMFFFCERRSVIFLSAALAEPCLPPWMSKSLPELLQSLPRKIDRDDGFLLEGSE